MPDGEYRIQDDVLSHISSLPDSLDILKQIQRLLRESLINETNKEKVVNDIAKLSPHTSELLNEKNSSISLADWIQIILAIVGIAIAIQQSYFKKEDVSEDLFQKHLLEENKFYRNQLDKKNPQESNIQPKKRNIISSPPLNKPCPCGSGKQFKRCHGKRK